MSFKSEKIETVSIHAGAQNIEGAVSTPIFQSSTYEFRGEENYGDIRYIRLNNTPNHTTLATRIAALERTETALVTSSGMAALSATLSALLRAGDHVMVQRGIYGGSFTFIEKWFERLQISWSLFDPTAPQTWSDEIRDNTKMMFMETITNPTIRVADLPSAVSFAKQHDLLTFVDNTFASPVNCRPAELGFDVVMESATKYLNGHSDIVAGVVSASETVVGKIKKELNYLGGSLDPHACFLLERGMKTLALRVRAQNENALALARHLQNNDRVDTVWYPGLEEHPEHALAKSYLDGFGGMVSFEFRDPAFTQRLFNNAKLALCAPSLGGVETLIVQPSKTSHASLTSEQRAQLGISENLVRVSVGIEHIDDILSDFD